MSDDTAPPAAVRVATFQHLWETCLHLTAGPKDHSCPTCHGTLRRCCDSLLGHDHRDACPEVSRRAGEDVA